MKVRAIMNTSVGLPDSLRSGGVVRAREEYAISVGREYVVYAITVADGHIWFYIVDDDQHPWPLWHPGPLFEIVDRRISKHWVFGYQPTKDDILTGSAVPGAEFAFPEWIDEPMFLERLTDNESREAEIFARYKSMMDTEFP